ncbi:MAG: hypothetical protein COT73_07810 [Bdellovibrio sp. CG10_big_fil_rev_8_21_14_0_10_47_8]|nr:MAG: hypothetical protein COT73_07810 [Bdellovibrio sp. CG10_big_fil_rev_8_21_14_0_10_47_8]
MRILFHGEGDSIRGTGHLVRALGMASDLSRVAPQGWRVEVWTNNQVLADRIAKDWSDLSIPLAPHYELKSISDQLWTEGQKSRFIESVCAVPRALATEILISDNKYTFTEADIEKLYSRFQCLLFVDNISALSLELDGVLFPNDYAHFESKTTPVLTGPSWHWMNPSLDFLRQMPIQNYDFSIFMGGADPTNLTAVALEDVFVKKRNARVLILTGPAFRHSQQILEKVANYPEMKIDLMPSSGFFLKNLCQAETCLVAFGLSSIELEQVGKKVVLYAHHEEHLGDAQRYLLAQPRPSILRDQWLQGGDPKASPRQPRPPVGQMLFEFLEQKT